MNPKWIALQITTYHFVSMLMFYFDVLWDGLCDSNVACMMLWSINLVLQNTFCCNGQLRRLNTFKSFFSFFLVCCKIMILILCICIEIWCMFFLCLFLGQFCLICNLNDLLLSAPLEFWLWGFPGLLENCLDLSFEN